MTSYALGSYIVQVCAVRMYMCIYDLESQVFLENPNLKFLSFIVHVSCLGRGIFV